MSVSVKAVDEITSGAGLWAYEEYNSTGVYNNLIDVGMVADSKLTVEREIEVVEDGEPVQDVKRIVQKEKGLWECILGEDIPEEKILRLGAGTIVEVAKEVSASKDLVKTLTETAFESLWVSYKANSSLEKSDFTVQTNEATPVPYSENDFEIGEKYGMLAIRRTADSDIPNRGEVNVQFSATIPGHKKYKFGGVPTLKEYYFQHGKKTDDGDMKYLKMYKVASPGKDVDSYPSKGVPKETYAFGLLPDTNRTDGDQLYCKDYEDDRIA